MVTMELLAFVLERRGRVRWTLPFHVVALVVATVPRGNPAVSVIAMMYVLVAAIGPAAEAALATRSIRAFAIQDFIPDALRALQKAVSRAQLIGKSTILED